MLMTNLALFGQWSGCGRLALWSRCEISPCMTNTNGHNLRPFAVITAKAGFQ
jgi:hypothetical protein